MAINLGKAVAYLELDTSKFTGGFKSAIGSLKVFGDKSATSEQKAKGLASAFKSVGSVMTKSVTLPILAVGTAAVKVGSDFEAGMSQVAATMGKPKEEIQDLTNFAKEMGRTTAFSATEAADGLNILAMAGLSAEEQMQALPDVLNLASAGALSLGDSATFVTGAVKGFGDSMDNATKYTDLIAKGATLANTNVGQLGEALSGSSAMARTYGQSAESTTLALLRLAEQNVTGAEATNALKRAMQDLYAPTSKAQKQLDALGVSAFDDSGKARDFNEVVDELKGKLSDLSEEERIAAENAIFSTFGMSAFDKMTASTADTVDRFKDGLNDASGSAMAQAQEQLNNLKGDFQLFKSALEGAGIAISETLIPMLRGFVQFLTDLVTKFNELSPEMQDKIVKFGLLAAAIGPVLLIVSKLITGFLAIKTAFGVVSGAVGIVSGALGGLLLPIAAVVAAIAVAVSVGVLLYKNWDTIKEKAGELKDKIAEVWDSIVQAFQQMDEVLQQCIMAFVNFVSSILSSVASWGANMIAKGRQAMVNFAQAVLSAIRSLPSNIQSLLSRIPSIVTSLGSQLYSAGRNAFNRLLDGIKSVASGIVSYVQGLASKVSGAVSGIGGKIGGLINGSHASGLDYVPFDGYIAELHEGERVLTKQEAKQYNQGTTKTGGGDTFNFYNTKPTPYEYARQMKKAKKQLAYGI